MIENLKTIIQNFYNQNILEYLNTLHQYPIKLVALIVDLTLVSFLAYYMFKIVKDSRAWQLVKGIALLVIVTWLSRMVKFKIIKFNYISRAISAGSAWGRRADRWARMRRRD